MNTVSQFVNNFFNYFVATAGFIFLRRPGAQQGIQPTPFPLPRCVAVSAKEA